MVCVHNVSLDSQYYSILSCSILSVLGCLFIILAYIILPKSRNYCFQIVLIISIADLIRSLTFLVPINLIYSTWLCFLTAALLYCTLVVSIVWTSAIAVTLYQVVIHSQQDFTTYNKYWVFLSISGSLLLVGPLYMGDIGTIGTICTFKETLVGDLWRLLLLYVPVWFNIILSLVCYFKIYRHICDIGVEESRKSMLRKFSLYPVVSVLVFTPLSAIRAFETVGAPCADSIIYVVVMCIFCLHGFFDCAIYVWAVDLRGAFRLEFADPCQEKNVDLINSSTSSNLLFNSINSID